MTIFSWNFNSTDTEEALSWEPQFSQDIDVDQVLLDENIRAFNMVLPPLKNSSVHNWPDWMLSLRGAKTFGSSPSDDDDGELS